MSMEQEVTGIAHVGIRVADLDVSRAFYEKLGFKFVAGPLGPEPVAFLTHPAGIEINLILNAQKADSVNPLMDVREKLSGYTHIALAVRDVEALVPIIRNAGIDIAEGPVEFPGAKALFIRDPDGNVVECNQLVS